MYTSTASAKPVAAGSADGPLWPASLVARHASSTYIGTHAYMFYTCQYLEARPSQYASVLWWLDAACVEDRMLV